MGGRKYYHIKYADGDSEDVIEKELLKILLPPKTIKTTPTKRKTDDVRRSAPAAPKTTKKTTTAAAPPTKERKKVQKKVSTKGKKSTPSTSTKAKEPSPSPTLSQGAVEAANAHVPSIIEPLDRSQIQPSPEISKQGATDLDQEMEMADFPAADAATQLQQEQEEDEIPARDRIPSPRLPRSTTTTTTTIAGVRGKQAATAAAAETEEEAQPGPSLRRALAPGFESITPVQRHPFPGRKKGAKEGLKASQAVSADGILHIGDVISTADVPFDQLTGTNPIFYRKQAKRILKELTAVLEKTGAGPEDLLSVSVKLKDSEVGFTPFCEAWNEWIGDVPPPTVSIGESYLGDHANLVAISALAKLPSM